MNAVLQFLDTERNEEEGAESIRGRLRKVINELGFDYFTLVRQPGPENPTSDIMLEGQWPKGWPELYVKRKYATIDPLIRYLGHSQRGYRWREPVDAFPEDPNHKRMERRWRGWTRLPRSRSGSFSRRLIRMRTSRSAGP